MAQLVTKKQLEDLLKGPGEVVEKEETEVFSYSEFLTVYRKILQEKNGNIEDTYLAILSEYLKEKCPPIRFINEGSSRAAFALTGGKCLKVAINAKGIAQNKAEIQISKLGNKYDCFTRVYEYDTENYSSILTECCTALYNDITLNSWIYMWIQYLKKFLNNEALDIKAMFKAKTFQEHLKLQMAERSKKSLELMQKRNEGASEEELMDLEFGLYDLDKELEFLKDLDLDPKTHTMESLFQFCVENAEKQLELNDLENIENWGLAPRNGKLSLVILDYGLSTEVFTKYYK